MADPNDGEARAERGQAVIRRLNRGEPQPALEELRDRFPFLAHAVEAYALGEVWDRSVLDDRTRQIATVAAFAALGEVDTLAIHAEYALNIGVSPEELIELVALTTVHAGFPRAITAANTISDVLDAHEEAATSD